MKWNDISVMPSQEDYYLVQVIYNVNNEKSWGIGQYRDRQWFIRSGCCDDLMLASKHNGQWYDKFKIIHWSRVEL